MWTPAPPTDVAIAARAAAEEDRRAHPERYTLDPESIAAAADRRPGDRDRFAPGWQEGLEVYLGSARDDGRLNALGISMVARAAIARLRSGVELERHLESHPEHRWPTEESTGRTSADRRSHPGAADDPLDSPIVIVGGWRTGTTFLHRLLATDPRLRAPLPAELTNPIRIAQLDPVGREAMIERSAVAHDLLHQLNPSMQAIHDSGARLAEECVLALGADLRNWAFTSNTRLDSYARWLAEADLTGGYAAYRSQLSVLSAADPGHTRTGNTAHGADQVPVGQRRWVLKAPAHLAELPALVAAFPSATVVWLQRDIVETISSGASLFATFRSTYSDQVDPIDVGRTQVEQTELWFRRAVAFRNDLAIRSTGGAASAGSGSARARLIRIPYERLTGDTVGVITEIYGSADMEPPADVGRFVDDYNASHPRGAHGTHRYDASDFGLDARELRERFAFADPGSS